MIVQSSKVRVSFKSKTQVPLIMVVREWWEHEEYDNMDAGAVVWADVIWYSRMPNWIRGFCDRFRIN